MRKCPDCGFRSEARICPLCGVRMQQTAAPVQTHVHTQKGERCALPNQQPSKQNTQYQPQHSKKKSSSPSGIFVTVAVIVLIALFRSCLGG